MWAVFGLFERAVGQAVQRLRLVGPDGFVAGYRKTHLPCLGADRFTDPGDRPFAVHDLGGLKLGMNICFDGSFPESARVLTLLGADLIVLPTNWATNARRMADLVLRGAGLGEPHLLPGREPRRRRVRVPLHRPEFGRRLPRRPPALAAEDREDALHVEVDPGRGRQKRVVHCHGEYEIDRVNWRRPELYGPLVEPPPTPFTGHFNK